VNGSRQTANGRFPRSGVVYYFSGAGAGCGVIGVVGPGIPGWAGRFPVGTAAPGTTGTGASCSIGEGIRPCFWM